MKKKINAKKIGTWVASIVLVGAATVSLVVFYNWSYKRGYADGTNNQVLCQAAVKDATLSKLCK